MSASSVGPSTHATPILDRLVPLPEPLKAAGGWSHAIGALIGLGISGSWVVLHAEPALKRAFDLAVGAWIAKHTIATGTRPELWSVVVGAALGFPVAILVHELGHVAGGVACGFRFITLRLGPLHIARGLRVSFRRMRRSGYLGWAAMAPVRRDHLRLRATVFVIAGPAINLISGALLLAFPMGGPFLLGFALVSVLLGANELLPIRYRTAVPDGRRLWMLWRREGAGRRWLAMMELGAEIQGGALPEDLSATWLSDVTALEDDSPDTVSAQVLAFSVAYHQHRDEVAARHLETALRHAGHAPEARHSLMSLAAVFQGRRRRNADQALLWLADLPLQSAFPALRLQAEAAMLEARGDFQGAQRKLDEVEKAVFAGNPDPVARGLALRLLARWRGELQSAQEGANAAAPIALSPG